MSHTARLTATLAALVLAATALAGCTAASEPAASAPSEKPVAMKTPAAVQTPTSEESSEPTPTASTPAPWEPKPPANGCAAEARIVILKDGKKPVYIEGNGPFTYGLEGEPVDRGPRKFAEGTVNLDAAGKIYSYTVAPGDVANVIDDRLCTVGVTAYTAQFEQWPPYRTIQPGDVLIIQPDPAFEWTIPVS